MHFAQFKHFPVSFPSIAWFAQLGFIRIPLPISTISTFVSFNISSAISAELIPLTANTGIDTSCLIFSAA
jgi:hypothetical protein